MSTDAKAMVAGAIGGIVAVSLLIVALLLITALPLFAQTPEGGQQATPTHEQMHQMMDAMHGEGTSARIHELMGAEGEQMMDQCAQMMAMMQKMPGMMGAPSMDMMGGMMGR